MVGLEGEGGQFPFQRETPYSWSLECLVSASLSDFASKIQRHCEGVHTPSWRD